jgi:hypothetical protein
LARKWVDRGEDFKGLNTTSRDSRLPEGTYREASNVRSPDGRVHRRWPYVPYSTTNTAFNDCCLTKHTSPELRKAIRIDGSNSNDHKDAIEYWMTPFSYGLIREHSDLKPRTDRAWTLEFVMKVGDISDLLAEDSKRLRLWPGNTYNRTAIRESWGAYIYDQCVTVGDADIYDADSGNTFSFPDAAATSRHLYAVAAVPSMAISLYLTSNLKVGIHAEWYMVGIDSGVASEYNKYVRDQNNLAFDYEGSAWTPGDTYHIALVYTPSSGSTPDSLKLYIHGVLVAQQSNLSNLDLASNGTTRRRAWAGQVDVHNGYVHTDGVTLQRDIVLLNEYTARNGMASSANVHDNMRTSLSHFRGVSSHLPAHPDVDPGGFKTPNYWCKSPPRGTGMAELRFWHEARTASEISSWAARNLSESDKTTPKGYWPLNDGTAILRDVSGNRRDGSLHLTRAAYVKDSSLLGSYGLRFADSQGLLYQFGISDYKGIDDLAASLRVLLGFASDFNTYSGTTPQQQRNSLTVQMQIRTPTVWQKNNLKHKTATDADALSNGAGHPSELYDGTRDPTALGAAEEVTAFYQTLWSIEAYTSPTGSLGEFDGEAVTNRVPILRGLADENGKFILEFWGRTSTGAAAQIHRLVSGISLAVDTVYTLTWIIKKNLANGKLRLELYKDSNLEASVDLDVNAFMLHNGIYSINIGCSGLANEQWGSIGGDARSFNLATGHRNNPLVSAPGYFTMGTFRLWSGGLDKQDFVKAASSLSGNTEAPTNLLVNLVIDKVYGKEVVSKAKYPAVFKSVYRITEPGFPAYIGSKCESVTTDLDAERIWDCVPDSSSDDCLGYAQLGTTVTKHEGSGDTLVRSSCQGLINYVAQGKESGLLAIYNNAVTYDKDYKGEPSDVFIPNRGLLNEWDNAGDWFGVSAGGKLFIASTSGEIKVFDGRLLSVAGIRDQLVNAPTAGLVSGGSLPQDKWFSLVLVYTDQSNNLVTISERAIVKTNAAERTIALWSIPSSPDSRSTGVAVFMSAPYDSAFLAYAAPVQRYDAPVLPPSGAFPYFPSFPPGSPYTKKGFVIDKLALMPEVLFEDQTPVPAGSIGTVYNDKLLIAGDPVAPSRVYWSFPGNYERFDAVTDFTTLEDAGGDQIVAMLTVWETVVIFKVGSIWRMVETAPGQFSVQKLTDSLGAIAPRSVKLITLPETGQTMVFFWSKQGPYLFDGTNYKYVGSPIEQTGTGEAFEWIQKPEAISVLHDPNTREIICFYQEKDQTPDKLFNAVVFDYRRGIWTKQTGVWGGPTTTVSAVIQDDSAFALEGEDNLPYKPVQKLLVGAPTGRVYELDASKSSLFPYRDYLPNTSGLDATHTILQINNTHEWVLNTASFSSSDSTLDGAWATVVKADKSDYFIIPIEDNDTQNIGGTDYTRLYLDSAVLATLPWIPVASDEVLLGLPPIELTQAWDDLELPGVDKEIVGELWWGNGKLYHTRAKDWSSTYDKFTALTLSSGGVSKPHIHKQLKAVKLKVFSVDETLKIDRRLVHVEFSSEGDL